jgi:hypothetical protein
MKDLIGKEVILKKISDLKYEGNHPNGVNEGFTVRGILLMIDPCIYIDHILNYFHTSKVKKIEGDKIYTLNSIYTIEPVNKEA